ncbi:MAG: hypothetical protein NTY19_39740 [Planctomycetota bacterium]|nr:hypothetical protein [Planctomycetota bacterium]
MYTSLRVSVLALIGAVMAAPASAQDCCGAPHRTLYSTVYEQQPVTTYRLEFETVFETKQITVQRPVWETEYRERRYTVAKPVVETSTREERYTVMRPVWETSYRDESFDRVHYVTETEMREERHVVARPVYEDTYREEQRVVRKPVSQTVMQDYAYTTYDSVTTLRTELVDQGTVVNNMAFVPGTVRNSWQWLPGGYAVDPVTGLTYWRRAGLYTLPTATPGAYVVQPQYVPNVVAVQRPQMNYVARVVTEKRPVEVASYVDEVVMEKVPVKTCRMEQTEEVRQVPITVQKPVVERVTNKVPVQTCRWVEQEMVRKVPVTTQRVVYEEQVDKVPVQVYKLIAETKTVQEPRTTATWRPYQATQVVPRTVVMRVPVDSCYSDVPTTTYHYPTPPLPSSPSTVQKVPTAANLKDSSVLKPETNATEKPAATTSSAEEEQKKAAATSVQPAKKDAATSDVPLTSGEITAPSTGAERKSTPKDSDPTGQPKLDLNNEELNKQFPPDAPAETTPNAPKASKAA